MSIRSQFCKFTSDGRVRNALNFIKGITSSQIYSDVSSDCTVKHLSSVQEDLPRVFLTSDAYPVSVGYLVTSL